jgi:CRP-like cAMP-binding protein
MISPELLRRFPFFAGFSDPELKRLAMAGRERSLAAGQILFSEGEPAGECHFLVEGEIEVLICNGEDCPESVALASLPAGELIGWSALVHPYVYTASARASRATRVIAFSRADLETLLSDARLCSLLMARVAQVIGRRLRDTRIQLLSLAARPD